MALLCLLVGLLVLFFATFAGGESDAPNSGEQVAAVLLGGLLVFVAAVIGGVRAIRFGRARATFRSALLLSIVATVLFVVWLDSVDCVINDELDPWGCYVPGL